MGKYQYLYQNNEIYILSFKNYKSFFMCDFLGHLPKKHA